MWVLATVDDWKQEAEDQYGHRKCPAEDSSSRKGGRRTETTTKQAGIPDNYFGTPAEQQIEFAKHCWCKWVNALKRNSSPLPGQKNTKTRVKRQSWVDQNMARLCVKRHSVILVPGCHSFGVCGMPFNCFCFCFCFPVVLLFLGRKIFPSVSGKVVCCFKHTIHLFLHSPIWPPWCDI